MSVVIDLYKHSKLARELTEISYIPQLQNRNVEMKISISCDNNNNNNIVFIFRGLRIK